jgi:hypothetical protein
MMRSLNYICLDLQTFINLVENLDSDRLYAIELVTYSRCNNLYFSNIRLGDIISPPNDRIKLCPLNG